MKKICKNCFYKRVIKGKKKCTFFPPVLGKGYPKIKNKWCCSEWVPSRKYFRRGKVEIKHLLDVVLDFIKNNPGCGKYDVVKYLWDNEEVGRDKAAKIVNLLMENDSRICITRSGPKYNLYLR